jgi:hypothetical protein
MELVSTNETITSEEEGDIEEEEEVVGEDEVKGSDGDSSVSSREQSSKNSNASCSSISSDDSALCRSDGGTEAQWARNGMALSHGQSMIAISSPARQGKKKLFSRSSSGRDDKSNPDKFLQNFNPKNKTQKIIDPGYITLRRSKPKAKSKGKKVPNRFSMKPQKIMSVAAEISSPSSVTKMNIGNPSALSSLASESLTRHPAIRSKRGMRIGQTGFSDTIPEASFTFEISNVPVVFKNTKMEIPCRGEKTIEAKR